MLYRADTEEVHWLRGWLATRYAAACLFSQLVQERERNEALKKLRKLSPSHQTVQMFESTDSLQEQENRDKNTS